MQEERTLPVDPQQGTCYLPFFEDVAITEPLCRSLVLETARGIVVCRRIGRRLPYPKSISQLSPCDRIRYLTVSEDRSNDELFTSYTSYAIRFIISFAFVAAFLLSRRLNISGVSD